MKKQILILCLLSVVFENFGQATPNNQNLFFLNAQGLVNGAQTASQGSLMFRSTQLWSITGRGTNFQISTTENNTTTSLSRFFVNHNGKVGIGLYFPNSFEPTYQLEVLQAENSDRGIGIYRYGGDAPAFFGIGARGSILGASATQIDDVLMRIGGRGHDGTDYSNAKVRIDMLATQNWNSNANGTKMAFYTTPNGATGATQQMVIDQNGEVGINRTTPQAKLDVDGDIILGTLQKTSSLPNPNFNALDREGKSVIRFAGTNPITLSGIAGGVEGMILYIYNYEGAPLTIQNEGAAAQSQNQIWTGDAGNIVFSGRGGAILVYDGQNLKWRVVSYNN